jgi:hypothetical protein
VSKQQYVDEAYRVYGEARARGLSDDQALWKAHSRLNQAMLDSTFWQVAEVAWNGAHRWLQEHPEVERPPEDDTGNAGCDRCGMHDRVAGSTTCAACAELCDGDQGCNGSGVLLVGSIDGMLPPAGWTFVQRCDLCAQYAGDEDAARSLDRPLDTVHDNRPIVPLHQDADGDWVL